VTSLLKLLVIEDSEADYLLVERNLKLHGVEAALHRVANYPALTQALEQGGWDAILSDYNLPGMDFRTTLGLVRGKVPDLPVILVSGSIGEEEAMDLLHSGLSDFVLKDRPARLAGALQHSLMTNQMKKARRSAEAALLESESRFATMFRSSPMGIGVSRLADGKLVEVNDALLEIFGRPREELIGRSTVEAGFFLHPADRDRMFDQFKAEHRVRNFQFQFRRSGGERGDLLMSAERIQLGGEGYLLGMVADITRLKAAERSLQASEGRYHSLFEHMSEGLAHCRMIYEGDRPVDWEYLAVNPTFTKITGFSAPVGRRASQMIPEFAEDMLDLLHRFGEVVRTGLPAKFERFLSFRGAWLMVSAYQPAPGEFVAVLDDITDRKRAEAEVRASEARFQAVFQASPVGIMLSRQDDGRIIEANPAFLDLIGYSIEIARGHSSLDLGLWVDPHLREKAKQEVLETGRVHALDAELRTGEGKLVFVNWYTQAIELNGEPVLVNLVQDMTEQRKAEINRRRLEEEVAHAQKLESLGALAGGVSHDMNNVLASIMALAGMLQERHKADPAICKSMDTLLHAAGRGRDLVKGLTDFARKDIPESRFLDLNEVVRKEAELLNRTTLQKVAVELVLQEDLPKVKGDESSISNALMNLCVNALDAMPSGGRLRLSTGVGVDGQLTLAVGDTGLGMTPEVVQRAMEPFFTTKPVGKGTGLGLALVYGVMKSHGGKVEIRSEPGQGTEILLSFPHPGADPVGPDVLSPLEAIQGDQLLILLVDDDVLIRSTVPAMLEAIGHRVVALAGGLEAVQRLQAGFEPDLVILDLSMPGLDGEGTLERLRLLKPDLPIILATGFQDDRVTRILERFPNVDVLAKPFTLMDLKVKLAQMT
jgi:two-component system cell cycle sensor histidine kinase/response regulator CckA